MVAEIAARKQAATELLASLRAQHEGGSDFYKHFVKLLKEDAAAYKKVKEDTIAVLNKEKQQGVTGEAVIYKHVLEAQAKLEETRFRKTINFVKTNLMRFV